MSEITEQGQGGRKEKAEVGRTNQPLKVTQNESEEMEILHDQI